MPKRSHTIQRVRTFQEGEETFDKQTSERILRIHHRGTINSYLNALGIPNRRLKWRDLRELLALKLFLADRPGGNSVDDYLAMLVDGEGKPVRTFDESALLKLYFKAAEIDLDLQLTRLKNRYEARNPLTGTIRYESNPEGLQNPSKPQERVAVGV